MIAFPASRFPAVLQPLSGFIGRSQLLTLTHALRGEEGPHFEEILRAVADRIAGAPRTYQTDGQGAQARAVLHYFKGGCDWWIVELDPVAGIWRRIPRLRAGAGYISIPELLRAGAELDLYFTPRAVGEILEGAR
jgi:hypothetical protein